MSEHCSAENASRTAFVSRRRGLECAFAAGALHFSLDARADTSSGTDDWRVTIATSDRKLTATQSQAKSIGDFRSEIGGFTQRCLRFDLTEIGMTIFFRPDVKSPRQEIVFEVGRLFEGAPRSFGPYEATIESNGATVALVKIEQHYYRSRWRWQSAPRPVVADVDTLIADRMLPPYQRSTEATGVNAPSRSASGADPSGEFKKDLNPRLTAKGAALGLRAAGESSTPAKAPSESTVDARRYSVMGLAGVTAYMPQTGERDDIGLVTGPQARYIVRRDAGELADTLAQAEAAGTIPWHFRDERTSAPANLEANAGMTWYGDQSVGSPHIAIGESPVTIDSAHQPALAYVPYILTGDPYFLEELQFQANWNWGSIPPEYRPTATDGPQPGIAQTRAYAWSLRSVGQLVKVTPEATPSWLLPRAHWRRMMDAMRSQLTHGFVRSSKPLHTRFRSTTDINATREEARLSAGTWIDVWQDEFLVSVIGWMIMLGFAEWKECFDWKVASTIDRTSKDRGWVRAYATPYRIVVRPSRDAAMVGGWAEAWALTQRAFDFAPGDNDAWASDDATYLVYTAGALTFAASLGVPRAQENLAWAQAQLARLKWSTSEKWAFKTNP